MDIVAAIELIGMLFKASSNVSFIGAPSVAIDKENDLIDFDELRSCRVLPISPWLLTRNAEALDNNALNPLEVMAACSVASAKPSQAAPQPLLARLAPKQSTAEAAGAI